MKKSIGVLLLPALLAVWPFALRAQPAEVFWNTTDAQQPAAWRLTAEWPLHTSTRLMLQGMDIWEGWLVSMEHMGRANVYRFDGKTPEFYSSFPLASYSRHNHANVACFGPRKANPSDPLPLLYVTRASGTPMADGWARLVYVERLNPFSMCSQTVQRICLQVDKEYIAAATQWVLDRDEPYLYTFSNTRGNHAPGNRHVIQKFRLPEYRGPQDSLVVLTPKDALEEYYVEDYYKAPFSPIVQGAAVSRGRLFLPTGGGSLENPSILYVWDLRKRSMQHVVDMQERLPYEFEDCTWHEGALYLQVGQHKLFKIEFQ